MRIRYLTYFLNFLTGKKLAKWVRLRPWKEKCFNVIPSIPVQHQDHVKDQMLGMIKRVILFSFIAQEECPLMRKTSKKRRGAWSFIETDKQGSYRWISGEYPWTVSYMEKGGSFEISSFWNTKVWEEMVLTITNI